jgi:TIR domain
MGRIEKTIFLSYRRTDEWEGVAIFQHLTQHGYDVFIDYDGIASGKFEAVILENIRARAHFLVLLTPTALERCSNPKDWMRREIEAALDSQRNIVPLMFAGFDFDKPAIASQLTGKLAALKEYNGLEIPTARFFASEMERLRDRFLNVPVEAVLHTATDAAQQIAKEQKDKALNARVDPALRPVSDSAQQVAKEQKDKVQKRTSGESYREAGGAKGKPNFKLLAVALTVLVLISTFLVYSFSSLSHRPSAIGNNDSASSLSHRPSAIGNNDSASSLSHRPSAMGNNDSAAPPYNPDDDSWSCYGMHGPRYENCKIDDPRTGAP